MIVSDLPGTVPPAPKTRKRPVPPPRDEVLRRALAVERRRRHSVVVQSGQIARVLGDDPAALELLWRSVQAAERLLERLGWGDRVAAAHGRRARLAGVKRPARSGRAPRRAARRPAVQRAASSDAGDGPPGGDGPPRPTPLRAQVAPGAASVHSYTDTPIHALASWTRRRPN